MELYLAVKAFLDLLSQVVVVSVISIISAAVHKSFHAESRGTVNKLYYYIATLKIHGVTKCGVNIR